jgi:hypothetical protein
MQFYIHDTNERDGDQSRPSTGKSYYAMIQDFNKSETHAWELLLGTPPPQHTHTQKTHYRT